MALCLVRAEWIRGERPVLHTAQHAFVPEQVETARFPFLAYLVDRMYREYGIPLDAEWTCRCLP